MGWGCEKCWPDHSRTVDLELTREWCRVLIAQVIGTGLFIPFRPILKDFARLLVSQNGHNNWDMKLDALIEELLELEPYLSDYYPEWRDMRAWSQS
ncbi:hypothetical protein RRF57_006614 [Xylaria bambusicola]|uniref:Uncharacterized protein n=1 Tax=Xylaria bambusicola TaxID=326684 RepID=A0AAN7UST6_9PEZI